MGHVEWYHAPWRSSDCAGIGSAAIFPAANGTQACPCQCPLMLTRRPQAAADFQPFYPTLATDVFCTRWLAPSGDQLFIVINRSGKDWPAQPLLRVSAAVGSVAAASAPVAPAAPTMLPGLKILRAVYVSCSCSFFSSTHDSRCLISGWNLDLR